MVKAASVDIRLGRSDISTVVHPPQKRTPPVEADGSLSAVGLPGDQAASGSGEPAQASGGSLPAVGPHTEDTADQGGEWTLVTHCAKRAKSPAEAKAMPQIRPARLTPRPEGKTVDLKPRGVYTSVAQVARYRVPSDSTNEWMQRTLDVMEGKVIPYTVCVDLDMTVWPFFADRDFEPPYTADVKQGRPAVKLGNGK